MIGAVALGSPTEGQAAEALDMPQKTAQHRHRPVLILMQCGVAC